MGGCGDARWLFIWRIVPNHHSDIYGDLGDSKVDETKNLGVED
jgi:hypothetical protein